VEVGGGKRYPAFSIFQFFTLIKLKFIRRAYEACKWSCHILGRVFCCSAVAVTAADRSNTALSLCMYMQHCQATSESVSQRVSQI